MLKIPVNFQNQKEYITLTQNVAEFNTACTSICFQNKGTATVDLVLASGLGTLTIRAGEIVEHNNTPDTMENNKYSVQFAASGTKNLFITKEHISRMYGGESQKLPSRGAFLVSEVAEEAS